MNTSEGQFVVPSVVATHFHLKQGDTVADFGVGRGFFLPELATRIGKNGRVYGCEIQKNLIEKIGADLQEQGIRNVQLLWCDIEEPKGTKIPDNTLDVGVLANTLYMFEDKETAVVEIARTLRSGGNLYVIDWTESFGGLGPHPDHVIDKVEATALFENNGFVLEREYPAGDHHYGLAFRKL